ncbi:uncharacterized protein TRIADDRAFT_61763 [Trichoplax adhaerens]|uniref:NOC3-like protein n=1 Tax=Trichoplax adhaerens TaxID=10228 RepID=B3SBW8_TRIAD|nr:hypothetical protein TRIADDRAFT_61763 [Trichoplax adhaerens]EDV19705.1 hypothetical protein TRIADDRAFT_61763 [Trichoplax adhaerens]|eukprot:XP_002117729.1 hypothetical protein TRIADDRAFT_61763 [Trichoplax adhaerens]
MSNHFTVEASNQLGCSKEIDHNSREGKNNYNHSNASKFKNYRKRKMHEVEESHVRYLLPIKRHGKVIQQRAVIKGVKERFSDSGEKGTVGKMESREIDAPNEHTEEDVDCIAQLYVRRQQKLSQKKNTIAQFACAIIENPEQNLDSLEVLRKMCKEDDTDITVTIRKLAMVSTTEVFKDIVPSYRIRVSSEKEQITRISKDVKRLRFYETRLLKNYQQFLSTLEGFVTDYKPEGKSFDVKSQIESSFLSMEKMVNSNDLDISKCSYDALNALYKNDVQGEISLEGVRVTSKMVKSKNFNIKEKVLDTFLFLRFSHERLHKYTVEEVSVKEKRVIRKHEKRQNFRKERKLRSDARKLQQDLFAVEGGEDEEKRAKIETEILGCMFSIYFQVLKSDSKLKLLLSVLKGIAKFAHLISIDYFEDLMTLLGHLLDTQTLNKNQQIACVLTAFKILTGRANDLLFSGEALSIDPRRFYGSMYNILLKLPLNGYKNDFLLLIECLELMLCRKRNQVTVQRLFAYIKRLCTTSLLLFPNEAIPLQSLIGTLLQIHPKTEQLLESDGTTWKLFLPHVEKWEPCDANITVLWELALLKVHYHPTLSTYSRYLSRGASLIGQDSSDQSLSRNNPVLLYEMFNNRGYHPTFPKEKRCHFKKEYQDSNVTFDGIQYTQTDLLKLLNNIYDDESM